MKRLFLSPVNLSPSATLLRKMMYLLHPHTATYTFFFAIQSIDCRGWGESALNYFTPVPIKILCYFFSCSRNTIRRMFFIRRSLVNTPPQEKKEKRPTKNKKQKIEKRTFFHSKREEKRGTQKKIGFAADSVALTVCSIFGLFFSSQLWAA